MGHPAFAADAGSGCESCPVVDYLEFPMYRQQNVGAPFKPYFGLSGIPRLLSAQALRSG
jgi:hypothetical protein